MATAIGDLVIRLGAQTGACDRRLQGTRALMLKVKASAMGLLTALAPLGGAYLFAGLIRSGEMFERKMRNSLAIMGNVSAEMKAKMRETAFAVGRETSASATQAAESYYFLASAGMNAAQSIAALPAVAKFAQAGNFDMATATDLATDAQSALGMTSKETQKNLAGLTRVTDVLIKANTLANASAEQFSTSLTTKAGAALRTVGKEIEEGVAVLAAWADQGIKGAAAGTAMNIVLRDLQSKALLNRKEFERAGVAVYDSAGEMRNLADIVQDLEQRLEGCSDAEKKAALMQMGFSDKSVIFIQTLLGCSEKIREYEQELRKAGGTCAEVSEKQLTPLQKGLAELGSIGTELGTVVMKWIMPALLGMFKIVGGLLKGLKAIIPFVIKFGLAFLAAKAAIWVVTVVIQLYTAATTAAAGASAFLLALAGPAGWAKVAAGALAATAAIAMMNKALGDVVGNVSASEAGAAEASRYLKEIGQQSGPISATARAVDDLAGSTENLAEKTLAALAPEKLQKTLGDAILWTSRISARAATGTLTPEKLDLEQYNQLQQAFRALRDAPGVLGEMATRGAEAAENLLDYADRAQAGTISAERFAAATRGDVDELIEISRWMETAIGNFESLEAAVSFAGKAMEGIRTPAEKLEEMRQKIRALVDLGLVEAADATRMWSKALADFDSAVGGPQRRIEGLRDELLMLKTGITQAELELRKLAATEGVTPEQIETIRKLQQEVDQIRAGKELTQRMQAPIEKALENARAKIKEIEELFAAGAIDEETRRRALEEQLAGLEGEGRGKGPGGAGAGAALAKGSAEAFHAILAAGQKKDEPGKRTAKNTDAMRRDLNETAIFLRGVLDRDEEGIEIPP